MGGKDKAKSVQANYADDGDITIDGDEHDRDVSHIRYHVPGSQVPGGRYLARDD